MLQFNNLQNYEVEFNKNLVKQLIASLLGWEVPVSLSRHLVSLTKGVPFYGQITSMISLPVFIGASTYAIGKVFVQHFESGGTFLTFKPKQANDYYIQEWKKCKAELLKWKMP